MQVLVSFPDHLYGPHKVSAIRSNYTLKLTFKVLSELPLHKSLLSADHAI